MATTFKTRDFWLKENLRYAQPYFRLEKCARIANALAHNRPCRLLDVGCGPGTLSTLLNSNIEYYGIDIAVHKPAPNLLEIDFSKEPLRFGSLQFDIVVAAGVFEYLGNLQHQKLLEMRTLLTASGKAVVTYTNFGHIHHERADNSLYNNVQPVDEFRRKLELCFRIDRWFPSSHNWCRSEPRRWWLKAVQMPMRWRLPVISSMLAVNYFFVCSLPPVPKRASTGVLGGLNETGRGRCAERQ